MINENEMERLEFISIPITYYQDGNGNELIDEELTIIEAKKIINQLKFYLENGTK